MRSLWLAVPLAFILFMRTGAAEQANPAKSTRPATPNQAGDKTGAQANKVEATAEVRDANPAADLAANHLAAVLAWQNDYRSAPKKDRSAVLSQRPSSDEYFTQFQELAEKHPGTPIAASAYAWMSVHAPKQTDRSQSLRTLVDSHSDSEELIGAISTITSFFPPTVELETQLKRLHERSGSKDVQAAAVFGLVNLYDKAKSLLEKLAAKPKNPGQPISDQRMQLRSLLVEPAEMERLYTLLSEEYRDASVSVMGRRVNLGEFADDGLFAIRNLSIGCIAPDIVGEDLDGVTFRLSDYRGKIVMLSFSADWCTPCKALYPHEQSIVDQLAEKPFVLIGVNCDKKIETAREAAERNNLTWRSFWNGKRGAYGPITKLWQVRSWPTIVVLDADGRIRYKGNGQNKLDESITALLAEMGHNIVLVNSNHDEGANSTEGIQTPER